MNAQHTKDRQAFDIIKSNADKFNDSEELADFIDNYVNDDRPLADLEDFISKQADQSVPIYYYDIAKQWTENTDCHGLTVEIVGEYGHKDDIFKMMVEDLYFYAEQQLREDYEKLLEIIKDEDATCDICHQPEDEDGRCGCTNADAN